MTTSSIWARLESRIGLVSIRPRIAGDVMVRRIGEDAELLQRSTRRVLPLSPEEARLVPLLDGQHSIAEIVVQQMGSGRLDVELVLGLLDRLGRSELLAPTPRNFYDLLREHLGIPASPPRLPLDVVRAAADAPTAVIERDAGGARDAAGRTEAAGGAAAATATHVEPGADADDDASLGAPWRARSQAHADRARFLRTVPIFAGLDMQQIGALTDSAHVESWSAGASIVSEGGRADRFFVIQSGEVVVAQRNERGERSTVALLGPGDWFGEVALREHRPRNATVSVAADHDAVLLSFDAAAFDQHIRPHVKDTGDTLVSRRREGIEGIAVFRGLSSPQLDRLSRELVERHVQRGTIVFRQGDEADGFYVIVSGSVGVVKDGKPIAKLTTGEFFGETALLFTDARTATIAATDDCTLWVLARHSFQRFLRDALLQRRDLVPTVMSRLSSNDPV